MSPLMGVVLSDVPPTEAGVGEGVLATTQQTPSLSGSPHWEACSWHWPVTPPESATVSSSWSPFR